MPSLALPPVSPALPVPASANMAGQEAAGVDGAQSSAESGEGGSPFAAVLNRQIAAAGEGAKLTPDSEGLTAAAEEASNDPSAQTGADLSALLQGLLLPLGPASATKATPAMAASEAAPAESMQAGRSLLMFPAVSDGDTVEPDALAWMEAQSRTPSDVFEKQRGAGEAAAFLDAETGNPVAADSAALPVSSGAPPGMQHLTHVPQQLRESADPARERMIVSTPVTSPGWAEDLGNKVSMLIGKELSSAELVLTPPSLGRVEVQLTVAGDQTSAVFVAATPAARDALEQALPKLRDFLADAGINLSQATVGGESSRGSGRQDGPPQRHSGGADVAVSGADGAAVAAVLRRVDGMVDTFA
ncbi:MAG TPA: flagellar hook-length control protein FliK [Rhodocyclaceae bacterium]|nr:flagellar hook-length control protein FliK [Rhodocyclaceae bacterium]